ncbi:mast cell protease 2-like isoform X2 [Agrilus planipennis]|uniref:Mast cell protease 2-like isoform X2 n=1 Tax=Agrilus planipennis TaxID=224129 RepID=A0A1W4WIP8_AGRPL|nr:mast cell protease 2-like isoform X2 [Agrilus planipennis]
MKFFVLFLTVSAVTGSPLTEEISQYRFKRKITVDLTEFPYHVQLVYKYNVPLITRCGGVIISESYVLTTANCVSMSPIAIITGIQQMNEISPFRQMGKVKKVKIHPSYSSVTGTYNIALIMLEFPLTFNSAVNKVELPPTSYKLKDIAQQIAWGRRLLFSLKYTLEVTGKQLTNCSSRRISVNLLQLLRARVEDDHILCAKGESPLVECQKFSGEPLVQDKYLIGLSITGFEKCKVIASTSVYTNVVKYVDWLTSEMSSKESTESPKESTTASAQV